MRLVAREDREAQECGVVECRRVTYRFDRFLANSDTRQLILDDREVHLSPKAFELLLFLLEHRSRAVSKAELHARLWPSTFVGETNLPTIVAEIRRALADDAQHPTYIRTVHRFGYRFIGAAVEGADPPARRNQTERVPRMYLIGADGPFELSHGETVIGRGSDVAVRIDAGGVSRHHARIVVKGNVARIEDLASKNGTFVDGKPLGEGTVLCDGAEIRVGPIALTFRLESPTRATETMD
jgi:DNA-binding winged helix-turn-helix (wHTH) protein